MINKQLINLSSPASSGGNAEAEQGLILHLDANDVDSYDGDGTEWVDISTFEKTIPLSDNEVDLEIHYDPSDINSYSGTGTTMTNLAGSSLDATVVAAEFDTDNGGFFDVSIVAQNTINVPNGHPLDGTGNSFTLEFWFNWISAPSLAERFIYEPDTGWNFFYYGGNGWRINNADCATGYFANNVASTAGEWNHFAMSQDASNCRVYINGTLVKTQAVTSGTRNIDSFSFGSTSLDGVNCKIGSIRMYSAALSASDIGQNYRHGRDTVYTDLIPDTSLELHLDADSFPEKGEAGYSNTPSTWTDSSGNSNNGTITSCEFDSELGNFLNFNGTTSEVVLPANLVGTDGIATTEFWVKGSSLSNATGTDILYQNANGGFYYVIFSTSSGLTVRVSSSNNTTQTDVTYASSNFNANDWYHIAATFSGASNPFKLYVNGELISQANSPSTFWLLSSANSIGCETGSDALTWIGQIGQVRTYTTTLTQDQIRQNYNFTKPSYPNGYDGTISGATWNAGGYFDFDGINDYIDLTALGLGGNKSRSVSVWVKVDSLATNRPVFCYGNESTGQGFNFEIKTDGAILVGYYSRDWTTTTAPITTNTWHHIVITYKGGLVQDASNTGIYVNNVPLDKTSTGSYSGVANTGNNSYEIGKRKAFRYFDGQIDSVKVYDKALTQAEITALYNEGQ